MKTPQFDSNGDDNQTFSPFVLTDQMNTEWKTIYLQFGDWDWFWGKYNTDTIDDYYLNGYGIQGLVKATLISNGINPKAKDIDYDSEAGTCLINFEDLSQAIRVAELAAQMITDPQKLRDAIKVAREQGFEDG